MGWGEKGGWILRHSVQMRSEVGRDWKESRPEATISGLRAHLGKDYSGKEDGRNLRENRIWMDIEPVHSLNPSCQARK